nr:ISL3 family transposase [Nonomuraea sp. FMUSA5-5]
MTVEDAKREGGIVSIRARVSGMRAACTSCGGVSARVHGRYVRRLKDAVVGGACVIIELVVRRFRCVSVTCPVKTFAEQVPGLTRPHARFTDALQQLLASIGMELAGRAGVRLAASLGLQVGRDTLLRRVRALPEQPIGHVRVLGVDDFATRKGHRYGTIMVDLETRRVVDMIDGRDGDSLAAWLREHSLPEVICRDRAGGYADGARQGAPDAVQVADRFHLWQNLGQAVEKNVATVRHDLAAVLAAAAAATCTAEPPPVMHHRELKVVTRLRRHHAAVHELLKQGLSKAAIGRELGLHPATVRKLANAAEVDTVIAMSQNRASILDGYHEHLHRRWNEGIRNAAQLTREITTFGYSGTEQQVQRYLRRFRTGAGQIAIPAPRPPSGRDITRWIMSNPDNLSSDDAGQLRTLRKRSRALNRLARHVQDFALMMTQLHGHQLDAWISAVEKDSFTALASFARNLRRDLNAVRNGLTLPHSSGPVEGQVNRVKMLKRQMFGRAKLDLLRKRTLRSA